MLYPLSYGGARAQSSDQRVDPGWQGVGQPRPVSSGPYPLVMTARRRARARS